MYQVHCTSGKQKNNVNVNIYFTVTFDLRVDVNLKCIEHRKIVLFIQTISEK